MTTNAGRARTWNNPTRGLPEPADASALWWYWPHALSERLADRTVSIGPARGALQEVLEAGEQPLLQWVAVDAHASGRAPQSLLVSARDAPLGHLLWALEVATGLQVRALGPEDLAEWAFAADRYPDRAERPDRLLRLPSLQCRSPHRTAAGALLLSGAPATAASVTSAQGCQMDALPDWLWGLMLQSLPPPEFVGLPADTDYTALASEGRMVAVWPQGVHLEAEVFEGDGSGSAVSVALPAF